MVKVTEFQGPFRYLSNFWPARVVWDDFEFNCGECAYVAFKVGDRAQYSFIATLKPWEAKRFGRTFRPKNQDRLQAMRDITRSKFSWKLNPLLTQQLIDTGDAILEEGNLWHDHFWGVSPPGSNNGKNWLGKIIMERRSQLQSGGRDAKH
jgi:predicted NAD-dependent protein-ADP-ribosyltransferase YbiA (DUF1768 family)